MRFHVLGICHTISNKEYISCAFTQKVVKFCEMMQPQNDEEIEKKKYMSVEELIKHPTIHYLIHYGHDKSTVLVDEHVSVTNDLILKKTYGNYDWKKEFFKHGANDLAHRTFTLRTIEELNKRKQPGDIILCFWGLGHKGVAEQFSNECIVVEPGIGYPAESSFADFKVFESYAVMHYHYGMNKTILPSWYHCVIPNYFNPTDFEFQEKKDNYFLYLGRITREKGVEIVLQLAIKLGFRLLVAGQGSLESILGDVPIPPNVEYVGYADLEKRKKLMANAKALLLPTYYIEPFGGVTVEAMMSGTPVITTDWGVFNETVLHGITGYRCRTMDQFEWAINNIENIDPKNCRDWAYDNYSNNRIRKMYEEYFDSLLKAKFNKGFYEDNQSRSQLSWLERYYPKQNNQVNQIIAPNEITSIANHDQSMIEVKVGKPKVLLFTETQWAFGRMANGLQKYCKNYQIDIFDWSSDHSKLESIASQYDLIYATVWDIARHLEKTYPKLKDKIIFSGCGLIDFVKQEFETLKHISFDEKAIDNFTLQSSLIQWMKDRRLPFSVISKQLFDLFSDLDYDFKPKQQIFLTHLGVDLDVFRSVPINNLGSTIKVLYNFPKNIIAGSNPSQYDTKRKWLVERIQNKAIQASLPIEFIYPEDRLSLDKMSEFYKNGDILLCVSHSEGGPFGPIEAGACGLTTISTEVGSMPELIEDGVNGFMVDNDHAEQIEKDIIELLKILCYDRELLYKMKCSMHEKVINEWTWEVKASQWEEFFSYCLEESKQLKQIVETVNKSNQRSKKTKQIIKKTDQKSTQANQNHIQVNQKSSQLDQKSIQKPLLKLKK